MAKIITTTVGCWSKNAGSLYCVNCKHAGGQCRPYDELYEEDDCSHAGVCVDIGPYACQACDVWKSDPVKEAADAGHLLCQQLVAERG